MKKTKIDQSRTSVGFAHVMAVVICLIVIAVTAGIGVYINSKSAKSTFVPPGKPPSIPKGSIEDTFAKDGKVFPNLPSSYSLIYQHKDTSGFQDAEYLTAKTENEIKDDMTNICKAHSFTIQPRGGNEKNIVDCIDPGNSWYFESSSLTDLAKQPWYKEADTNVTAATNWLHVVSSGAPVYN
jgi:hypothetical protein